ncbi:hypothetical protein MMYC01_207494 [Madurella mycetomatis]|uniref:Borealin N-terminal domain-containing protein n=1 Tax=Madurella mycetomatis TaxID=100816 RepID=A0A175VVS5_9PEZI|nr:hypothetical protein MMYC01_207494 [Madurella mycetomatis]
MYHEEQPAVNMMSQKIPTKDGNSQAQESPFKRRKTGITLAQKQALIDNLQLEITERARKLRANYNIHAQSLRTRIEIRVNRIPLSLRKFKMGDLLQKYSSEQQQKPNTAGPPVPAKDSLSSRPPSRRAPPITAPPSARPAKRLSHEISGGDKENDVENIENPKKKARSNAAADPARGYPAHVLSPTTSNSRVAPQRTVATPGRSGIARPAATPGRTAGVATNILSNMVDKARGTRGTPERRARRQSRPRRAQPTAPGRRRRKGEGRHGSRRGALNHRSRPATRTARRASGDSESSEASTSTVVRKRPATAPPGAAPKLPAPPAASKRTVMGTIRKGVTTGTTKKAPAAKAGATPASTASAGRVLRKRA